MATYVAVRGHFELPDGTPAVGTVTFAPQHGLQDTSTGEWVLAPLVATLDNAGELAGTTGVNVRALDDTGMVLGAYYEVTIALQNMLPTSGVLFVYVADAGTGVNLGARLIWSPPGSPPDAYVLLPVFTAHVADVTDAHGLSLVNTLLGAVARVAVAVAGVVVGARRQINLIAGSNVTISAADNPGTESTDVTISATGGGGGMINPMTLAWDIIVGGALGAPTRLARGQVGQRLIMDPNRAIIWGDAPPLAGIGASFTAPGDAQYGLTCALTLDASSPYITGTGTYAYYRAPAASPTVFSAITTSTVFAVHDVLKITCLSNTGTTSATLPRTA